MKIKEIRNRLKTMLNTNNVEDGYWFWFWKLYNIVLGLFEYDGLVGGLTKKDIEDNLLMLGHCSFIALKDGSIFTPFSRIFDFDKKYQPTKMVYANPRIFDYKTYKIGVDCEVVYNTTMKYRVWQMKTDGSLFTFIGRYARQLADLESTINIYTTNARLTSYPVTDGDKTTESIKAFFEKMEIGERAVISDDAIINRFRSVDITRPNIKDGINDWLIAKDKILEQFFRDIGVKMYNPKKAQVTEEELDVNNQLLIISIDDMLNARREGLERVNNMFGTNITVSINPRYDINNYNSGGVTNEQ